MLHILAATFYSIVLSTKHLAVFDASFAAFNLRREMVASILFASYMFFADMLDIKVKFNSQYACLNCEFNNLSLNVYYFRDLYVIMTLRSDIR